MKKTWQQKLNDSKDLPKVVTLNDKAQEHWHGQTMIIPTPLEVSKIMGQVPKGKLITIDVIRKKLANIHNTDIGCPLTCGIFAWIAAQASEESKLEGKNNVIPWWRTIKSDGSLNDKFPGGVENHRYLLLKEGHNIIQKGKKLKVDNFEYNLVKI